ncbi:uncharacterized protein LOC108916348 [Anoplophora glabripennis]|uniref:uncharacterized protein LOC108916348 n=1 Tax=Anoplophora glabripennis TaxID=217634 RepID=UPI0008742C93|nr:uncharacterized protein LOC108916348 [Anoplophora glabripennis]
MAKLVLLFVCVAVFQLANALQCYQCEREGCEKEMKDWQKSQCGKLADTKLTNVCLKQVYKDKTTQKEMFSRKCVSMEKDMKYKCDNANGEQVVCETCDSDLCNSATKINFSLVAVSGIFLALLMPKFLA